MSTIVLKVKYCCPCKGHREKINKVLCKIEGIERQDVNLERQCITIVTAKDIDVIKLVEKLAKKLKRKVTLEEPRETKANEVHKGKGSDEKDIEHGESSNAVKLKATELEKGKETYEKAREQGESSNAVKLKANEIDKGKETYEKAIEQGESSYALNLKANEIDKVKETNEKGKETDKRPVHQLYHEIFENPDVIDYTSTQFAPSYLGQHSNPDSCSIM